MNNGSKNDLWRASHESRHFHFEAFGFTADEATAALVQTLEAHQRQTGAALGWLEEAKAEAAEPQRLLIGVGYRDGEAVVSGRGANADDEGQA